eukprot:Rmarinus@m.22037
MNTIVHVTSVTRYARTHFPRGSKRVLVRNGVRRMIIMTTIRSSLARKKKGVETIVLVEETTGLVTMIGVNFEETMAGIAGSTATIEETTVVMIETTVVVEETMVVMKETTAAVGETMAVMKENTAAVEETMVVENTAATVGKTVVIAITIAIVVVAELERITNEKTMSLKGTCLRIFCLNSLKVLL